MPNKNGASRYIAYREFNLRVTIKLLSQMKRDKNDNKFKSLKLGFES